MSLLFYFIYDFIFWPFISALAPMYLMFQPKGKISASLRGQKQSLQALNEQIKLHPLQAQSPRVWFHVASAGEFLQARPVMDLLKEKQPDVQIALTYVSPSAVRWVQDYKNADWKGYAPFDSRSQIQDWLKVLQPHALVLVKFDLWPNMLRLAKRVHVATFLISATLSENSGRFRNPFVRAIFRSVYAKLDHILCVGAEDERRFRVSNPDHRDIRVVGDTRVDSVLQRQKKAAEKTIPELLEKWRQQFQAIVIAGSSWPKDEALLLPTWKNWQDSGRKNDLLILAPHEPHEKHLQEVEQNLAALGLESKRYSQMTGAMTAPVILIDQMGLLADLYRIGNLAFIGSGEGGVHNTMEPAAWSLPVCFRPAYQNAPEAIALVKAGLFQPVGNERECLELFGKWLKNLQVARDIGHKGREFLDKSQGATYTCYESLRQEL